MIRVLVVGCGAMGTHHARVVAAHPDCELVGVRDVHAGRAERLAEALGVRALSEVPDEVDAAVVAVPSDVHGEVALPLLARGLWCLVEKPLALDAETLRALDQPRCRVGHSERFNPVVRGCGVEGARVVRTRRAQPARGVAQAGDVLADLLVHDLDLARRWTGEALSLAEARCERVDGRVEAAALRWLGDAGAVVHTEVSRVAAARERWAELDGPSGSVRLDLLAGSELRGMGDTLHAQWDGFVAEMAGGAAGALATPAEALVIHGLLEQARAALDGGRG